MAQPWRLPEVNGDDGAWGDILNQYLNKEHYNNDNSGAGDAASGGHMNVTLRPGTTTAGTAPLKFTSGTNMSAVEAGAMEYNGTSLFFSPSATRYNVIMNGLGLSGGQTVIGGTAATDVLQLQGTSANGTLTSAAIQAKVGNVGGSAAITILNNTNIGIGNAMTAPTASLHIEAGTTAAGTAPLKFSSGTNLSAVEAGAMEYNGTSLLFTPGTTRYNLIMNGLGLSGGQTVIGGTAATDVLKIQGTSGNGTLTNTAIQAVVGNNGGTVAFTIRNNTNIGVGAGMTAPTANLHIEAGTTAASTAPLKFTSGSLMTTAEAGAIEFLTDKLYFTKTTTPTTARMVITTGDTNITVGSTDPSIARTPVTGDLWIDTT